MSIHWSPTDDSEALLENLKSDLNGLDPSEVEERTRVFGRNDLAGKESRGKVQIFVAQFKNSLIFLLIAVAIVSYLLGEVTDAIIISSIVILNSMLGFFQEYQSEKAVEKLKELVTLSTTVRRNGQKKQIDSRELVPGDIVYFGLGNVVPADIRLLDADEIYIDESSLTGEPYPVQKRAGRIEKTSEDLHELINIAFASTYIQSGKGHGVVVETGRNTFIGKTAKLLGDIERRSQFQQSMEDFSMTLLKIVAVTVVIVILLKTLVGSNITETILFTLALAVGMVPEALPIVVTISLSNGAMALAKRKVVVKRLVSVEDLGNVDVICTDKTGTITENAITFEDFSDPVGIQNPRIMEYAFLCTPVSEEDKPGSPIDRAIRRYAHDNGIVSLNDPLKEIVFNSNRKRNSVLIENHGESLIIVKGAPEFIIERSLSIESDGHVTPLEDKQGIMRVYNEFGNRGLRTIAVAYKRYNDEDYQESDESDLTLLGYIGFIDPPKASAKEAFRKSRDLFIDVKVLTGDGPYVTMEIARQIGLDLKPNQLVLGSDIDAMSDEELEKQLGEISIVCRATPEQKYKVIKALKRMGRVTACLGDGVNDAPALKEAHVGIAVDQGTDIAKDAADIVLLEKDLKVVIDGIELGRKTFSNIVKYVIYTIAGNFGDLYTVAVASLFMAFLPLLPSQLILSNFLTDTPVVSVSTDNVEDSELVRPRRWDIQHIFRLSGLLGAVSAIFDGLLIVILLLYLKVDNIHLFRTALFLEIVLSEILVLFMIRSDRFFLRAKPPSWQLVAASIFAVALTLSIIYLPISPIFDFTPLTGAPLLVVILITIGYVITTEIVKIAYFKNLIKPRKILSVPFKVINHQIANSERRL